MTTVGKLIELLKDYPKNMVIMNEQGVDFIHIVNMKDAVILSTNSPIGWCNRSGEYVYPSVVEGYSAYSPSLDEDLFGIEWTPMLRDKEFNFIKEGCEVLVDSPTDEDSWNTTFMGEVINPNSGGYVIVSDNAVTYAIKSERLKILKE